MIDYEKTHLCGDLYGEQCEHLLYVTDSVKAVSVRVNGRKRDLQKYFVYCLAEGRCRSMGCAASWTGFSPKWCPKRKALEARHED